MASALMDALLHHDSARALALIGAGADLEASDECGNAALHIVTLDTRARDATAIVAALIAAGADVHQRTHFGSDTALHYAAFSGHAGAIRLLVAAGIDVNDRCRDGGTPLHLAVAREHLETCAELVRHGADVNARNNPREDYWPLLGAAAAGISRLPPSFSQPEQTPT